MQYLLTKEWGARRRKKPVAFVLDDEGLLCQWPGIFVAKFYPRLGQVCIDGCSPKEASSSGEKKPENTDSVLVTFYR